MNWAAVRASWQARWQRWSEQFLARQRRERALLAAALVFGGGFLLFNFAVDPALRQARAMTAEVQSERNELQQQQAQLAALQAAPDPDRANRQRLAELKKQLNEANQRLASFEAGMVPPERMRAFLEDLLLRNRGVELLELKVLPPQPVDTLAKPAAAKPVAAGSDADAGQSDAASGIWQHGIELKLAGSYNDVLNYLKDVEAMPQHVMWRSLSLTVEKYPRNQLLLRVYTLSLDQHWLEM
jgi:MSHA biogenesis protein MshJ